MKTLTQDPATHPVHSPANNPLNQQHWELLFDTDRSARYNNLCFKRYTSLHQLTGLITLLSGAAIGTTVICLLPAWLAIATGLTVFIAAASNITIGFSTKANEHNHFKKQYLALMSELETEATPDIQALARKYYAIEDEEKTSNKRLKAISYNNTVKARYHTNEQAPHFIPVPQWLIWRMTNH